MTSCNSIDEEWRGLMCRQGDEDGQRDSRGRDLEINMPGLCGQWDMSGKVKEKLLLISWHLVHSKKKKRERKRNSSNYLLKGYFKIIFLL